MKRTRVIRWLLISLMALGLAVMPEDVSAKIMNVPAVGSYGQTEARSVYHMINRFRAGSDAWYWDSENQEKIDVSGSLHRLTYNYDLEKTAMLRAMEIAVYYNHVRPNMDTCFTAFTVDAYSMSENIAVGYDSPSAVFEAWMESDRDYEGQGQRRNMLSNEFNAVGVGHVVVNGVHYWVQAFAYTKDTSMATEALNGTKTVDLEIDSAMVRNIILTSDKNTMSLSCGEKEDLPLVQAALVSMEAGSDPAKRIPLDVSCSWKSLNPMVAYVCNGSVRGVRKGTTTLVATAYGRTLSIPVKVSDVDTGAAACR